MSTFLRYSAAVAGGALAGAAVLYVTFTVVAAIVLRATFTLLGAAAGGM